MPRSCSVKDCSKPARARGWCSGHWQAWRKYGDPLGCKYSWGEAGRYLRETALTYIGDECLIWPYTTARGYARVRHDGRMQNAARIICEVAHGPAPSPLHEAAHTCGKGHLGCVAPHHLYWATHAKNQGDRLAHGTHNRGERQGLAKLTETDVKAIRGLAGHIPQRQLGEMFDVHQTHIGAILRGDRWGWLT